MKEEDTYQITKQGVQDVLRFLATAELPTDLVNTELPKDIESYSEMFIFLVSFYAELKKDSFKEKELYEHAELWKFISEWATKYAERHMSNKLDGDIDEETN